MKSCRNVLDSCGMVPLNADTHEFDLKYSDGDHICWNTGTFFERLFPPFQVENWYFATRYLLIFQRCRFNTLQGNMYLNTYGKDVFRLNFQILLFEYMSYFSNICPTLSNKCLTFSSKCPTFSNRCPTPSIDVLLFYPLAKSRRVLL